MSSIFVSKTQAISIIGIETGYGRRVIEKTIDNLLQQGRIRILEAPDARALRISRTDVELIIKVLKGEIE
jgi:biotin operon repressor